MTTTHSLENEITHNFEKDYHQSQLLNLIPPTKERFQKILNSYVAFNLLFCALIAAEVIYLLFHLSFLIQTFVLAIHLALLFATIFSYFTFRLYFQTHKTEKYLTLRNDFIQAIKGALNYHEEIKEHHQTISQLCCKLAGDLHGKEYQVYTLPSWLEFLASPMEKLSCWSHWQDVHFMKEILLQASVEEHIKLVQMEPTHLETHVGLANAYVMLSGLYVDPRTVEGMDEERWIPSNKYNEAFGQKFRSAASKAIEEFKILSDYAPDDPWVHAQLAYSYHDLNMHEEEIKEYETLLRLCPEDREILFKLGKLYFEQGRNAKGLQVYESLKKSSYKKAEVLIGYYGAHTVQKQATHPYAIKPSLQPQQMTSHL